MTDELMSSLLREWVVVACFGLFIAILAARFLRSQKRGEPSRPPLAPSHLEKKVGRYIAAKLIEQGVGQVEDHLIRHDWSPSDIEDPVTHSYHGHGYALDVCHRRTGKGIYITVNGRERKIHLAWGERQWGSISTRDYHIAAMRRAVEEVMEYLTSVDFKSLD